MARRYELYFRVAKQYFTHFVKYLFTMFQAHQLPSFCLFHVACMYTTEEEPANKLYLCWFLNTAARLSLVDQFISFIWPVHRSRVGT